MSRGRKKQGEVVTPNWEQFYYRNLGTYLEIILRELSKTEDKSKETGLTLFQQIQEEKKRIGLPAVTLAEIHPVDTPFEISKNWHWCRLDEICIKIGSGSTPKGGDYSDKGYPFFRSQNIHNFKLVYDDIKYISKAVQKKMRGTVVYPNDILLNITGGSMGRCAIVPPEFNEGNVSQHVCIIRPIKINSSFLHIICLTPYFQSLIFSSTTGAGREGLPKYNLEKFLIPLPPLQDQKDILDFLNDFERNCLKENEFYFNSTIEKAIVNLHRSQLIVSEILSETHFQLAQLQALNQVILREAVQGKLLPQYSKDEPARALLKRITAEKGKSNKKEKTLAAIKPEEIPFKVPSSWVWCRLGDIAYITSGSTPSKDAFVDKGIPFLKMYNLRNQRIDFEYKPQYIKEEIHNGQLKRCRAYPGDIIMNIVGPPLGKIAIVPDTLKECNFNQAAVLIRPMIREMNTYIYWFLNEMSQIRAIDTKGIAGQDNISVTQAQLIKIPIPSLDEQKRIVKELENQLGKTNQLKQHIIVNQNATQQLLKALLHQAFEADPAPQEQMTITRSITVSDAAFWQNQLVATYIKTLKAQNSNMLQGEMGLVKYSYLDVAINKTKALFTFRPWIFGPYTEEIKEILHSNADVFTHKKVGNKGFEVYDLGKTADRFIDRENPELKNVATGFQRIVDVFKPFSKNERTRQLELVACVCWLIEKLQTLNISAIYQGMKNWPTPKREEGKNKAEIFTKLETVAAIDLIKQHHWHKKLLKIV